MLSRSSMFESDGGLKNKEKEKKNRRKKQAREIALSDNVITLYGRLRYTRNVWIQECSPRDPAFICNDGN